MSHQEAAFSNKSVLVTGGSRGLGRALAGAFAAAGARVVIVARDEAALAAAARDLEGSPRTTREIHVIRADIADKEAAHVIAARAAAAVGPLDLLVNNASTLGPVPLRLVLDTECEDLERALAVNVVGPFRLTKVVAGSMVLRGAGTIVNVSSDAAVEPYPTWGAYGASKAAFDHLGGVLAAELDGTGVHVLTVDPGEMNTRMHADAMPDVDPRTLAEPALVAARIVRWLAGGPSRSGARFAAGAAS